MKYLSNFKKIILICVKNKWLASDPFGNFKFTRKPVEREALTEHELKKIAKKTFAAERLIVCYGDVDHLIPGQTDQAIS
jgi:hypothetical protein